MKLSIYFFKIKPFLSYGKSLSACFISYNASLYSLIYFLAKALRLYALKVKSLL